MPNLDGTGDYDRYQWVVYGEGDARCVPLKGLDAAFRNVVPDFDDFVVASCNDVEVWAVLIVGLGWMQRIGSGGTSGNCEGNRYQQHSKTSCKTEGPLKFGKYDLPNITCMGNIFEAAVN